MKSKLAILFTIVLLTVMVIPVGATTVPTMSIINVVQDQSVTIQTNYLPANDTFNVTMGFSGTQGVGGILVSRLTSGPGGTMLAKFQIPDEMKGQSVISIRLESPNYPYYYCYNWFYNTTGSGAPVNPYPPYPYPPYPYPPYPTPTPHVSHPTVYFDFVKVVKGVSVTVRLVHFPANRNYGVYLQDMLYGSDPTWYGITAFNSADGGIFNATFNIPVQLRYALQIRVKIQDEGNGVFTYNWFNNVNYP